MKMKQSKWLLGLLLGCLSMGVLLLAGCGPSASPLPCTTLTITVTKTADTNDGVCSAADCSLREAVIMTNTCPGQQEVRIPSGTYTLTIAGADEDAAATGDLDVTDETMFSGIDNPIIDGNQLDRVFHVGSHPAHVMMLNLTIQNGRAKEGAGILNFGTLILMQGVTVRNNTAKAAPGTGTSHGGGILSEGYGVLNISHSMIIDNSADQGGGVVVLANLMYGSITPGGGIWDSVVSDNTAAGGGGGLTLEQTVGIDGFIISRSKVTGNSAGTDGGGVQNFGKLLLYQSTVEHNTAEANGGGIFNIPSGFLKSSESALTSNQAVSGGGLYNEGRAVFSQSLLDGNLASGEGGAIFGSGVVGEVDLDHSTVSGNTAPIGGAAQIVNGKLEVTYSTIAENTVDGIHHGMGTVWFQNSILDRNGAANCTGLIPSSSGYNIDNANTCSFSQTGDQANTDPLLGPLAANGGLTLTHALDAASPAIDSAAPTTCSGTDQRGVARPQGTGCDRGAYEREAPTGLTGSIGGLVWHDLCSIPYGPPPATPPPGCVFIGGLPEANGLLEPGEPGIPGVTLHLKAGTCAAGADLATAVTDSAGAYSFSGLAAGTYCVSADALGDGNPSALIPGGWSFPDRNVTVVQTEVTLTPGEIRPDVNFGWDFQFLPEPLGPTPTPTPAAAPIFFLDPWVSTEHVYFAGPNDGPTCDPREVKFQVGLSSLEGVANVNLFVRLKEQSSGMLGGWSNGIPMNSIGNNQFLVTLLAEDIPDVKTFGESWLQYQFVALDKNGETVAHSEVFWDVTLSRCGRLPGTNK
jgi:CSLREA domain-containing protein